VLVLNRLVIAMFSVWMLALTAAFYAFPAWHLVLWSALALSSAGAIVAGTIIHRPSHPIPWWLLALAITLFASGDATYIVLTTWLGQDNPFPSLADVFYLTMYPIAAAGLVILIRRRSGGRDKGSVLDALSVTTGLALLTWIFLIDPYVRDGELDWVERATSIAYPLGDVLIVATLARLLITGGRNHAAILLGVGTASLLASDVGYSLAQLNGSYTVGNPYDFGWALFYTAWGAAALHPSMAELTVPKPGSSSEITVWRIALLMAVSLVAPGALLVDALTGEVQYGPIIATSSVVLLLLLVTRLAGVMARLREGVERERILRSAGDDLVSAADVDDVTAAVRTAARRLLPALSRHRAVLLSGGPIADVCSPAPDASHWASQLVPGDALGGAAGSEIEGFQAALLCPLLLVNQPTARPSMGLLVVAADETVLLTLRGALEILASQAALALERVTLSQEVSRRNNEAYFRTLVQNAHDVILIVDETGRVRYASPSTEAILGSEPVVGTPFLDLLAPENHDDAERALALWTGFASSDTRSYQIVRADRGRIDVEVASRDLRDDPTVRGIVLTLRDVTEQRKLEHELTHRASHDGLTGLANRVLFGDRVEQALTASSSRDGGVVGVLLVDLDDFKLVNDTMGHGAGDELLVAVATRLTAILRPGDLAARLGGDEFGLLIEAANRLEIEDVAARVVDALGAPLDFAAGLTTSVSIGVATTPGVHGAAEMLSQADLALYAAKGAGKGRWRTYEPGLRLAAVDRLEVRTELEQAITSGAFALHYQPIVELSTGAMVGVEALVRWRHARRGLVAPADFITIAEETGLVVPLGSWVLECAFADFARWPQRPACGTPMTMNVNVSARQVRAPGFLAELVEALTRWNIPGGAVALEITETSLLTDDARVSADLATLRELGVRIAIDDFGTGYSSLDYLRRHAIDVLKIDRSFINGIETSFRQAALVGAIVHLAQALELRVVAEGVETTEQRDALLLAGCTLGQGYFFSRPVPADEIEALLRINQPVAQPRPAHANKIPVSGYRHRRPPLR
jgi:diguanylate cyclase (GGDEF)-like protein/PAS domain S-box-containing protein